MPEVMEVKKYVDFINESVENKKLLDIKIKGGRYKKHGPFPLYDKLKKNLPLKLIKVYSKGKFIYMIFENDYYIINTLGLSGGWAFIPNRGKLYKMPKLLEYIDQKKVESYLMRSLDHINVEFIFSNGTLYFFDMLSYGTLSVLDNQDDLHKKLGTLGPDIMDELTTYDVFKEKIITQKNANKDIGNVIVNQKLISGVGNYIRSDALWLAKINPFRKIKTITEKELKDLFHSLKVITWGSYDRQKGIRKGIIKKTDKIPADYKRDFFIYREDEDIYGNKVLKKELFEGSQKRFIYYVKEIQI